MYEQCCVESFVRTHRSDSGLNLLMCNKEEPINTLFASEVTNAIWLNFIGKLTRMPLKHSLNICDAFGGSFYMDGRGQDNPKSSDHFVPAWMVKEVSGKDAKPVCRVVLTTHSFEFKYRCFLTEHKITVPVTFYSLQADPQFH